MKAVYLTAYGAPDVLTVRDVPMPTLGANDVLVRQRASSVSPADCAMRSGNPALIRLFTGLLRPKSPVPGGAVAGIVEAVGAGVTRFRPGDRVFGTTDPAPGAKAEFVVLPEGGALATMPDGLGFDAAAGLTYSVLTALPFLRDEAKLEAGQTILINGGAGSVGGVAVQLAKHMGAAVTAVCSGRNADLVRGLGADYVIDRTQVDFTTSGETWDVIFDAVGKSSFAACRKALKPDGIYLTTVPSLASLVHMLRGRRADGKRARLATTGLRSVADKAKDMEVLAQLAGTGAVQSVIDRRFALDEIAEAHRYVELGTKAGDVVVTIG